MFGTRWPKKAEFSQWKLTEVMVSYIMELQKQDQKETRQIIQFKSSLQAVVNCTLNDFQGKLSSCDMNMLCLKIQETCSSHKAETDLPLQIFLVNVSIQKPVDICKFIFRWLKIKTKKSIFIHILKTKRYMRLFI